MSTLPVDWRFVVPMGLVFSPTSFSFMLLHQRWKSKVDFIGRRFSHLLAGIEYLCVFIIRYGKYTPAIGVTRTSLTSRDPHVIFSKTTFWSGNSLMAGKLAVRDAP